MRNFILVFIFLTTSFTSTTLQAQSKKKAEKDMFEWRYEIEAVGTGSGGTYQVKVWTYSKKPDTAIEQAKKNAVHGIIFRGFPKKDRVAGKGALATNPNLEQEKKDFFDDFFKDGGKYLKFVSIVNNGAIAPEDLIKIGKEFKIGVVVSVDASALRKDLEAAGIIKGF